MLPPKITRSWPIDRICPALFLGILLSSTDYLMDLVMDYFGTNSSKTILNNLGIGVLGGATVFFYLKARCQKCEFENAKERINLIGDLNRGIRGALGAVVQSAMSEDKSTRLRCIDELTDRIDKFLCGLWTVPKSGNTKYCALLSHEKPSEPAAARG